MSAPFAPAPEPFRPWLKREFVREAKFGLVLFVLAVIAVSGARKLWSGFDALWDRLNYQLSRTALNQHPLGIARTFGGRLGDSEYGWNPLSWSAPFNVTAARAELRHDYPEVIGVFNGEPVVPRADSLRRQDPARYNARIAAFTERHRQIESRRFTWLHGEEDTFSRPDPTATLGQMVTKILGFPDAFIFTLHRIISAGITSILLFCTVLALSGLSVWRSKRPARRWLKLMLWPFFASGLVWVAIVPMALAAAIFGAFTPNTSVFAFVAAVPLLLLAAKAPFRLAENLLLRVPPGASALTIIKALTRAPFPIK